MIIFVRIYSILHSGQRESWHSVTNHDIAHYWRRLFLHVPVIHDHMHVGCPHELCEARNVNVNRQIESKYHVAPIAGLSSCAQIFVYALVALLYGKPVTASCDYTLMIFHKTIAIFYNMLVNFMFDLYTMYILYTVYCKRLV